MQRSAMVMPLSRGAVAGLSSEPAWFSCEVDGAEGDEDFTGYAVGWTSGSTAWLVVAEDRQAARALITELGRAAEATPGK